MKISPNSNKTFNNQITFLKIANYLKEITKKIKNLELLIKVIPMN